MEENSTKKKKEADRKAVEGKREAKKGGSAYSSGDPKEIQADPEGEGPWGVEEEEVVPGRCGEGKGAASKEQAPRQHA